MSYLLRKYLQTLPERTFFKESIFMDLPTMENWHSNIESYSVLANGVDNLKDVKAFLIKIAEICTLLFTTLYFL
jgi:hypothetical protein